MLINEQVWCHRATVIVSLEQEGLSSCPRGQAWSSKHNTFTLCSFHPMNQHRSGNPFPRPLTGLLAGLSRLPFPTAHPEDVLWLPSGFLQNDNSKTVRDPST